MKTPTPKDNDNRALDGEWPYERGHIVINGDVVNYMRGGSSDSKWSYKEHSGTTFGYIRKEYDKRRKKTMKFTVDPWKLVEKLLAYEPLRTLFLYGPPGIGKTFAAYHYGRKNKGVYAVTLTDETSAAELRGHFIFKGGDAVWHDGPFVRAMREGCRLVINEISNASADVLALLFPVLESFETARLTLPSGETVTPSDGFHVVATDNRSPQQLPEALQDRFMAYVELKEMHPEVLDSVNPDLREIARTTIGEGDRFISARGWKHLQTLSEGFGTHDSCRLAFGMERGHMVSDAITLALEKQREAKSVEASLSEMEEHNDDVEEDDLEEVLAEDEEGGKATDGIEDSQKSAE